MSRAEKILDRMRNNPRDWKIQDLEAVAKRLHIRVRQGKGSHVVFQHDNSEIELTVPAHRPIKPIYIRQFLRLIEDIME